MLSVTRTLAIANLVVQLGLLLSVFVAYALVRKRQLKNHCTMMTITVPALILTIFVVMLPSMLGYIRYADVASVFSVEVWLHHILGLAVIGIWIYVNLVYRRVIKTRRRLKVPMRIGFTLWMIVAALGIHLFASTWI